MESSTADFRGVPIGLATIDQWIKQVATRYNVTDWTRLNASQRKQSLYFLYDSRDRDRFEEVVQYVITGFPYSSIEDLQGDVSLLAVLSTSLAVEVVRSHCSGIFSLKQVPSLMQQGICPQKLEKLIRVSQEARVQRREVFGTMETVPERFSSPIQDDLNTATGGLQSDGPESYEMSLRLQSYQAQVVLKAEDTKEFLEFILEKGFREKMGSKLDVYCQRMLSLCGSCVNLNNCPTIHGNILHAAAKFGLAESAKESLAQGYYNMLLELDNDNPNTWPLVYAIRNREWLIVKVILETLNFSQRQAQIRTVLEYIDCEAILKEMRDYHKPRWGIDAFHSEKLKERLQMEGRSLLMKAVLDTTMKGCDVDPSLLLFCDNEGSENIIHNVTSSTDEQDGAGRKATGKSLYHLICDSGVEELKFHPSFAAVVQHTWREGYYGRLHGFLFVFYMLYLLIMTAALVLATKSSDPREYNDGEDYVRLFFEIITLLYIFTVLILDTMIFIAKIITHFQSGERNHTAFILDTITVYNVFETVRYSSTLLIIPLRIADSTYQWQIAALAIILSGLRLFHYATVLPFMGKYVGTLFLLVKQDFPRLLGVFLVINFSFGTGLYLALVGNDNRENVDIVNENSTSDVYWLWVSGAHLVIEDGVIRREGLNWAARLIYWLFVFCVSVAFVAILIAQFETSFTQLAKKANLNVILKKVDIMQKMDRIRGIFGSCGFLQRIPYINKSFRKRSCGGISRQVLEDPDDLDPKDYVVGKLSRKLAENDKRVQILESKLDKVHELLLSMNA